MLKSVEVRFVKTRVRFWHTSEQSFVPKMIRGVEKTPETTSCPYHGGHDTLTLSFEEGLFAKVVRAVIRSETKSSMEQIGISLHAVKSKEYYNVQFICKACLGATDMLHLVAEDPCLRDLADRTMMQFFSPYFNVLSIPLPHPPPPPPLKTKFAPPPPPSGARVLRDYEMQITPPRPAPPAPIGYHIIHREHHQ